MTVSELIEILRKHPAAMRVVLDGYEEGYDDVKPNLISVRTIQLHTGSRDWEGEHGDAEHPPDTLLSQGEVVKALVLKRSSF